MLASQKLPQRFWLLVAISGLVANAVDIPAPESFLRRVWPSATVLGDYVYFDGGEVSELVNGIHPVANHPSYWVNSTISIDLRSSWTNMTVCLQATPKTDVPIFNSESLWLDVSSRSFYIWSGSMGYDRLAPNNELWKFTADGNGGGAWESVKPGNEAAFSDLVRPRDCMFCVVNNTGYCLGGVVESKSDPSIPKGVSIALSGIVSYDIGSQKWENISSVGFGSYGTLFSGRAEHVPFGPNGLILVLGGFESPVGNPNKTNDIDFGKLWIWDPSTRQWYSQLTTGSRPTPRHAFCSVGVQGPNNTYEIFIYGGWTTDSTTSDRVYVLSLPGFVFFQASEQATPRAGHACVLVGKRQMLSIGGNVATTKWPDSLLDQDPWSQGLGVMDMPKMSWTSSYDASAADYDSPEIIKDWYSQGELEMVAWTSEAVRDMFTYSNATKSGSPLPTSSISPTTKTPVGAIAGGVIGGVAGLGLISTLVILPLRHRRKSKQSLASSQTHQFPVQELDSHYGGQQYVSELPSHENQFASELPNDVLLAELPGSN